MNKRTKHIDIKYHFIREFIRSSRKIVLRTSVQRIKKCHYSLNMKLKSMTDFLLYGIKSIIHMIPRTQQSTGRGTGTATRQNKEDVYETRLLSNPNLIS